MLLLVCTFSHFAAAAEPSPYQRQVAEQIKRFKSSSPEMRAGAAEALGFLRPTSAADALAGALRDESALVRREAALALGWCGGRTHVAALLTALEDQDWVARQSAWVGLCNLTGMDWPFDALAAPDVRFAQAQQWRKWWAGVPPNRLPAEIADWLQSWNGKHLVGEDSIQEMHRVERGLRAAGMLGGDGAGRMVRSVIAPYLARSGVVVPETFLVQAGLRSLGLIREPENLRLLVAFLDQPQWARYSADALADFGDAQAVGPLLAAYPSYARDLTGKNPQRVPEDDKPGFEAADRMYETAFAIASALARSPLTQAEHRDGLRLIAPLFLANLPSDFDGPMLYEQEACQLITVHLMELAGLRQAACDAAFASLGLPGRPLTPSFSPGGGEGDRKVGEGASVVDHDPRPKVETETLLQLARRKHGEIPHAVVWLPALCRDQQDVPRLIALLENENGWARINAAKALMFLDARNAIEPLARILASSRPEAAHGWFTNYVFDDASHQGQDEYHDPPPRWREAYIRALGRLQAAEHAGLLGTILRDERNALEMQHAAALALDEIGTPQALETLREAEANHPYHSVRLVAREALWRRDMPLKEAEQKARTIEPVSKPASDGRVASPRRPDGSASRPYLSNLENHSIVFIKGPNRMPNRFQIDPWRQTYSTTDSGPTYRLGWNLFLLNLGESNAAPKQLTHFTDGCVADCEVSWDGQRIIFSRRDGHEPWWHIWEINADGSGLRQLTRGPYHDVQPAHLSDGRIVFSTTRIGMRDEYHGYLATGLAVMDADGGDIHCIGFNLGRDNEPAILKDGRIVFSRLELFYSRLKTELAVHAVFPDGTRNVTLYGPERRDLWHQVTLASGEKWWGEAAPRHRVLRLTQPQPLDEDRLLCATTGGLAILGPGQSRETFVPHDKNLAVTTPFPLGDGRVLCAAVEKKPTDEEGNLGLHLLDLGTGRMELLYRDPAAASFEPRPLAPRQRPPLLTDDPRARSRSYTAQLLCGSARFSRHPLVQTRARLVRVIEGMPVVGRHYTHRSTQGEAWKNHVGTFARVLGTSPLAADGSFFLEVPADRLIHLQVLDEDRRVVGNQQVWMYARPGEKRSCVGCHEKPDSAPPDLAGGLPLAARTPAVQALPTGGELTYRAKAWQKGTLRDETEDRTRTVQAVNLIGRR